MFYSDYIITIKDEEAKTEYETRIDDYLIDDLQNEQITFQNNVYNQILDEFIKARLEQLELSSQFFINHPSKKISSASIDLFAVRNELSENWAKNRIYVKRAEDQLGNHVIKTLLSLKDKYIQRQLKQIENDLAETTDESDRLQLMNKHIQLKTISQNINSQLTRVISF